MYLDESFKIIHLGGRSIRLKNTNFSKKLFILSFDENNMRCLLHKNDQIIEIPLKSIGKIELYPRRRK